jgi:murein DD-endopeptidase MepM/ murein hydrolase activator NlpD
VVFGHGLYTISMHRSRINVREGERVAIGDLLGLVRGVAVFLAAGGKQYAGGKDRDHGPDLLT